MRDGLSRVSLLLLGLATIASASAQHLGAQSLAIQGLAAHSSHSLVGNLLGGEIEFRVPLDADRLSLQVGVAHLAGSSSQFVTTCHGFIFQAHCDPEPMAGDARLTSESFDLGVRLWRRAHAAVQVTGGLRLAEVHVANRGLVTDRTFSGNRTWWGGVAGLEATLSPWRRLPVALQLSGEISRLQSFQSYFVADAYLPLDVSSTLTAVRLGIIWRPRQ